ncbi:MAG: hypothetical protein DMG68_03125 [Acidobacteria bacterium]|jgi:hypothetical protein|nr:MAG: hypothetical protein DMG68_03125 [Acidobacteriota bacterium]
MLFFSHIWDGLLKLATLVGFIVLAVHFGLDQRIHPVPLMIGIVAGIWILIYRQYLSIVSSWLYAHLSLRTNVSFSEAKALRKLFQLDVSGKWVQVSNIKKLPSDARHDAVMQALERFSAGRKAMLL